MHPQKALFIIAALIVVLLWLSRFFYKHVLHKRYADNHGKLRFHTSNHTDKKYLCYSDAADYAARLTLWVFSGVMLVVVLGYALYLGMCQ